MAQLCGECRLFQESVHLPGVGSCLHWQESAIAHDFACGCAARSALRLQVIDPPCVWSVLEGDRVLARIERLYDATWVISALNGAPYDDGIRYADRTTVVEAVQELARAAATTAA